MDEQEQQFLNMLDQFRPVINKVCFMYATNDEPLGDLYQEVVLQLWKAFPRFRGESKMSTWVYRIAMNTCVSNLRHRNVRPQTSSLRLPHGESPSPDCYTMTTTSRNRKTSANSIGLSVSWANWNVPSYYYGSTKRVMRKLRRYSTCRPLM